MFGLSEEMYRGYKSLRHTSWPLFFLLFRLKVNFPKPHSMLHMFFVLCPYLKQLGRTDQYACAVGRCLTIQNSRTLRRWLPVWDYWVSHVHALQKFKYDQDSWDDSFCHLQNVSQTMPWVCRRSIALNCYPGFAVLTFVKDKKWTVQACDDFYHRASRYYRVRYRECWMSPDNIEITKLSEGDCCAGHVCCGFLLEYQNATNICDMSCLAVWGQSSHAWGPDSYYRIRNIWHLQDLSRSLSLKAWLFVLYDGSRELDTHVRRVLSAPLQRYIVVLLIVWLHISPIESGRAVPKTVVHTSWILMTFEERQVNGQAMWIIKWTHAIVNKEWGAACCL